MSSKGHILIVEDEPHIAHGMKYNLKADGYDVTHVGDGRAALETVQQRPSEIDLVILDLMLPGMSGYAVCEALRAEGHDMPVLILSARTLAEDRTRGFEVGADQYLMKPFDLDELLTRVRGLLARHGKRVAAARQRSTVERLEFGESKIDFTTFEAAVRGQKVKLTRLEMELLRYFVERPDRVVPREELLREIWGMPGTANTRAPDQFLVRLRKIFEKNPAQPRHFLTIRDIGYRFVPNPDSDQKPEAIEAEGKGPENKAPEA